MTPKFYNSRGVDSLQMVSSIRIDGTLIGQSFILELKAGSIVISPLDPRLPVGTYIEVELPLGHQNSLIERLPAVVKTSSSNRMKVKLESKNASYLSFLNSLQAHRPQN